MFSHVFLAVTGREMEEYNPKRTAYLSCHFSPYGKGLSNLPNTLPPGSLLILDDSMPPEQHDPEIIYEELTGFIQQFSPKGILLDFQNKPTEKAKAMAAFLTQRLPCPVAATPAYAKELDCPVFLPPPPANRQLKDYLAPWQKQGIYLEIAPEALTITVTEKGSIVAQIPPVYNLPLRNSRLHCHYNVSVFPDKAVFTLSRNKEDLQALIREAEKLGVHATVGLYWELQNL